MLQGHSGILENLLVGRRGTREGGKRQGRAFVEERFSELVFCKRNFSPSLTVLASFSHCFFPLGLQRGAEAFDALTPDVEALVVHPSRKLLNCGSSLGPHDSGGEAL